MDLSNDIFNQDYFSKKRLQESQYYSIYGHFENDSINNQNQDLQKNSNQNVIQSSDYEDNSVDQSKRVNNHVVPNMNRQIRQCLQDTFQGDKKFIFRLLNTLIEKFDLKYQIWAFDAILLLIIFLRDKLNYISKKKYISAIDNILSTLQKSKSKLLSKRNQNNIQLNFANQQYALCIQRLKIYDKEDATYDSLCNEQDNDLYQYFKKMLASRKVLAKRFILKRNQIITRLNVKFAKSGNKLTEWTLWAKQTN